MKDIQEIDRLILEKEFFELSSQERELVLSQVKNEQEYNQLKYSLRIILQEDRELIEPKKSTKTHLIKYLKSKHEATNRAIWLNSFWAWLMPTEKPFYYKPGLQLVAIASIALLVIVVIPSADYSTEIAMNTTDHTEEVKTTDLPIKDEAILRQDFSNKAIEQDDVVKLDRGAKAEEAFAENTQFMESEIALQKDNADLKKVLADDKSTDEESLETLSNQIITGYTQPSSLYLDEVGASHKTAAPGGLSRDKKLKEENQINPNSRALSEDKEFISLLFTAL
ncbi:MAG: hypothetical protein ACK4K0_10985 [Flavobacteriales bacterium]